MIRRYSKKICIVCGEKNGRHKDGCNEYKKMLIEMFGSIEAIFDAADKRLLPKPPWELK